MEENGVETPWGANQEEEEETVPRGKKKVAHFEMRHGMRSPRVNERSETEEKGEKVLRRLKVCFHCREPRATPKYAK